MIMPRVDSLGITFLGEGDYKMKKTVLFVLLTVMAVCLCACGKKAAGKGSSGNSGETAVHPNALENVTESNYVNVVKDVFGIELKQENGWTVSEVLSPNKVNNLRLTYKTPADFDSNAWNAWFENLVSSALSADKDGIYALEINPDTGSVSKGGKYADANVFVEEEHLSFSYSFDGNSIQLIPVFYNDNKGGEITLSFTKTE